MNIVEVEISKALAAAGCGIVRRPQAVQADQATPPKRDWLIVATKGADKGPSLAGILLAVSDVTGIDTANLKSPRRRRDIVRARMIYCAVARQLTNRSFPAIGRSVGGRDHSTVMHGIAQVEERRAYFEPHLSQVVAVLK